MTGILTLYSGGTQATRSHIKFSKYQTGTKILQQGDDLGDFTLTLPGASGTLATQEWINSNGYCKFGGMLKAISFTNGQGTLNVSSASGKSTVTNVVAVVPDGTYEIAAYSTINGGASSFTISIKLIGSSATQSLNCRIIYSYL